MSTKRSIWAIVFLFAAGIAMMYVVMQVVGIQRIFEVFLNATPLAIIGFLAASTGLVLLLTYKWQVIIECRGHHIPFRKLVSYRMIGYAISYLTPSAKVGGEPVRAYLLTQHDVKMNEALSSAVIDKSVEIVVHLCVFAVGAILIINTLRLEWRAKVIIGSLTFVVLALTFFVSAYLVDDKHKVFRRIFRTLRLYKIKKFKKVESHLIEIEEFVEEFYKKRRKTFYYLIFLNLGTWILMYFEYFFGLMILGHTATVKQIFIMLTGVGIAYTIPLPMAFGVLELSQVGATQLLGISAAVGVALSLIIRARDLIWTGIGCVLLFVNQLSALTLFKKSKAASVKMDKKFKKEI